jgi:hypothetical protein
MANDTGNRDGRRREKRRARVAAPRARRLFCIADRRSKGAVFRLGVRPDARDARPRTAEVLAENDLGARSRGSPAASRGKLFLRSDDRLFAIGK